MPFILNPTGPTGPTGATGSAGTAGATGATGSAGSTGAAGAAALWNFTGPYSGGASYAVGDIATYDGETWYRINSNGGNVGDTPVEGTFWTLLAEMGDTGPGVAGVTADAAELNILDGATLSTTELNYVDGVTSDIQTQLNAKAEVINMVPRQVGTTGRYHTVQNVALVGNNSASPGACTPIRFLTTTTIEKIALYTFVAYTGATATYRLGLYETATSGNELTPGVLLADAGTLTLANPTAVGLHELTFATPVVLAADTLYWMVCAHTNTTVPFTAQCSGNIAPAASTGLQITTNYFSTAAVGYRYAAAGGTALVDPFVVDATIRTSALTPLVFLKVQ